MIRKRRRRRTVRSVLKEQERQVAAHKRDQQQWQAPFGFFQSRQSTAEILDATTIANTSRDCTAMSRREARRYGLGDHHEANQIFAESNARRKTTILMPDSDEETTLWDSESNGNETSPSSCSSECEYNSNYDDINEGGERDSLCLYGRSCTLLADKCSEDDQFYNERRKRALSPSPIRRSIIESTRKRAVLRDLKQIGKNR
uniref:Uncharacterized protein n=1 Tax=Cyclophora tenuis TaxID=216820 RepID=A0A7S1GL53_CYCTE